MEAQQRKVVGVTQRRMGRGRVVWRARVWRGDRNIGATFDEFDQAAAWVEAKRAEVVLPEADEAVVAAQAFRNWHGPAAPNLRGRAW